MRLGRRSAVRIVSFELRRQRCCWNEPASPLPARVQRVYPEVGAFDQADLQGNGTLPACYRRALQALPFKLEAGR